MHLLMVMPPFIEIKVSLLCVAVMERARKT